MSVSNSAKVAAAIVVWGVGLVGGYAIVREETPGLRTIAATGAGALSVPEPDVPETAGSLTNVIEVPPIVIVARSAGLRRPPSEAPHPAQMQCGPWRELVQGGASQRVRPCDVVVAAPVEAVAARRLH